MSGVNKVILLGRLGRDPEVKNAGGVDIANFSIATSKQWKDANGEKQERTEWHNVVAFKKLAETCGKYLTKGKEVYIEGELQTRSWDDKETGVKKYKTEIVAQNVQFVGSKTSSETSTSADTNEEIPF